MKYNVLGRPKISGNKNIFIDTMENHFIRVVPYNYSNIPLSLTLSKARYGYKFIKLHIPNRYADRNYSIILYDELKKYNDAVS